MNVIERLAEVVQSARVAASVAATTVGTGVAEAMSLIPSDWLGKVATLIGIVLSLVLIYTHIKRYMMDKRNSDLDYELKIKQLKAEGPRE